MLTAVNLEVDLFIVTTFLAEARHRDEAAPAPVKGEGLGLFSSVGGLEGAGSPFTWTDGGASRSRADKTEVANAGELFDMPVTDCLAAVSSSPVGSNSSSSVGGQGKVRLCHPLCLVARHCTHQYSPTNHYY